MTGIGAADQVLLLLREQLQRSDRARLRNPDKAGGRAASPHQRIAGLAAIRDLPERDFRRALIRSLLSERLGEALVADPAFDRVADAVLRTIEESDEARALLDRAAAGFRAA